MWFFPTTAARGVRQGFDVKWHYVKYMLRWVRQADRRDKKQEKAKNEARFRTRTTSRHNLLSCSFGCLSISMFDSNDTTLFNVDGGSLIAWCCTAESDQRATMSEASCFVPCRPSLLLLFRGFRCCYYYRLFCTIITTSFVLAIIGTKRKRYIENDRQDKTQ